jgi:cytochrome c
MEGNMKLLTALTAAGLALAVPALAEGDPAAGEKEYAKCRACHMVVADDGTEIQKGGRTGPNLYGIVGRVAGTTDFKGYSDSLIKAGEKGLVWDAEQFAAYVTDPTKFLRTYLDDAKARGKMTFKLPKGAEDVWAYLASVSPAVTN